MVQIFSRSSKIINNLTREFKITATVKIDWALKVHLEKDQLFKLKRNNKKIKQVKEGDHRTNKNKLRIQIK
jgi:hypothetical protein